MEKISEKDLFFPSAEFDAEVYFNKWLSLSATVRYGHINNNRNDLQSWDAGLLVYFSPLTVEIQRLKIGGGIVYRNLGNKYLKSWSENGNGEKMELCYTDNKYNTLGIQLGIESEWIIAKRFIVTPNLGCKYYFQDFQAFFAGVKVGYKF